MEVTDLLSLSVLSEEALSKGALTADKAGGPYPFNLLIIAP